jgi:cytochrome c5
MDAAPPPPKMDAAPKLDVASPPSVDAAPPKPDVAPPPPPPPPPPVAATPTCAGVQVFVQQCNFCHVQAGIGKIDLITEANLIDRLKAKSTSGTCTDRPLVDSTVGPDGKATGVLFDRLTGTSCGPRMPPSPLSADVIDCIRLWAGAKIKGQ